MKEWTGTITEKSHKDWHNIRLYSFNIEGEDRWFRTGKTEIEMPIGASIHFMERNNQVVVDSITLVDSTKLPVPVVDPFAPIPVAVKADVSGGASIDVGKRIQWQAARRDACAIVVAALHCDHLPHASNVAKGKRLDLLMGYVKEITEQLLEEENNG